VRFASIRHVFVARVVAAPAHLSLGERRCINGDVLETPHGAYTRSRRAFPNNGGTSMPDSVYRVTQVIGTSTESWGAAARNAVETAARTVRDLRVAEIDKLDVIIEDGKITTYRARVNISFKYITGD
jgi:flavin-binding protein dodecin